MSLRKSETREEYNARVSEYLKKRRSDPEIRALHNARMLAYYHAHKLEIRARRKQLQIEHRPEYLAKKRVYQLSWRQKLRREALIAYGGLKCACCGESTLEFLGIDHIDGDGNKHFDPKYGGKKRLGGNYLYRWLRHHNYPPGFQVLCHNCNLAKGFYGICPHQKSYPKSLR